MSDTDAAGHDLNDAAWSARQEEQALAFDRIGHRYDEAFPHKSGQIECVEALLTTLAPGANVLDLGCGTGLPTTRRLVEAGCRVTGVELSPVMLDLARANAPRAHLVQADMTAFSPEPGSYDAVVAFFSLLQLTRARIPRMLTTVRHALVPGGRLCLSMVEADLDDVAIPFLGNRIRVTGYPREELRVVLGTAGFHIEKETVLTYAPVTAEAPSETQLFLTCRRA
ncbi:class I SAM-dependent DNA methyltransferase [Nocardiopsis ansamitocini]|uniref:Methyltransferase n=1 Tax=Nocardiopsis ansamitocini TaxID=1670832 RepID=A0A9W6UH57_9ACTN|nr:class I SAM-dependent methyltransferase [Nocardiopsis ansamitocini]GLU46279.1 methyltransferase [Nocardiopsis ansamitocini]